MADDDERGRDKSGRYSATKSDDDYLELLRTEGPMAAKDIADKWGITKRGVFYRLKDLEEEGRVESEQYSQTKVWSIASDDE